MSSIVDLLSEPERESALDLYQQSVRPLRNGGNRAAATLAVL